MTVSVVALDGDGNEITDGDGNSFTASQSFATPLILDLDGDGVETTSIDGGVSFDLDADGTADRSAWVGEDDGLLVRDINLDGQINDGSELFGAETIKQDGTKARDGFDALQDLDSNQDGQFDASDEAYNEVKVWQDANQDGVAQEGELRSLSEAGVASIQVEAEVVSEVHDGNITGLRSSWTDSNAQEHTVDDVWFAHDKGSDTETIEALETADTGTAGLVAPVSLMADSPDEMFMELPDQGANGIDGRAEGLFNFEGDHSGLSTHFVDSEGHEMDIVDNGFDYEAGSDYLQAVQQTPHESVDLGDMLSVVEGSGMDDLLGSIEPIDGLQLAAKGEVSLDSGDVYRAEEMAHGSAADSVADLDLQEFRLEVGNSVSMDF